MISAAQKRDWLQDLLTQAGEHPPPSRPAWRQQQRQRAAQALGTLEPPHRRQEAWRYSRIDRLFQQHFQLETEEAAVAPEALPAQHALAATASYRLVFHNGRCLPRLSNIQELPEGVVIGCLSALHSTDPELLRSAYERLEAPQDNLFAALNSALEHDGAFIYLPRDTQLERPIELISLSQGGAQAGTTQGRHLIILEAGARATLLERSAAHDEGLYFQNTLTGVSLGEGASLEHYRYQQESPQAFHLSQRYLDLQRHSRYRSMELLLGGAWSRSEHHVGFQHPEASCQLDGLYTVGEEQHVDTQIKLDHRAPGCTSRVNYRGIVYGRGHAVFDGLIRVAPQGQRSDAQLSNKNLLLSAGGEVDTKPQLEIYADEVKCAHGTTVGQIDPQQVFYLRSRGIDGATARRMLCLGFAAELLESIALPELREHAGQYLQEALAQVVQAPETP